MDDVPHSKGHSRVDEPSGDRHLPTGHGEEGDQLAQAQHDGHANGGDDEISEQQAQRPPRGEGPGGAQEETSTDDTANAAADQL